MSWLLAPTMVGLLDGDGLGTGEEVGVPNVGFGVGLREIVGNGEAVGVPNVGLGVGLREIVGKLVLHSRRNREFKAKRDGAMETSHSSNHMYRTTVKGALTKGLHVFEPDLYTRYRTGLGRNC